MQPGRFDYAVVGAGIVGLAVARELLLRRPGTSVVVLERERLIAGHQSSHNSGVIHAGVYYAPGSLKARLCVRGAALLYEYCERHGIEARRLGKLIIATRERELAALAELERRGHANGVPGLRRLDASEIRSVEPEARGLAALHSPATGVVDFGAVAVALAAELGELGGELRLGWPVAALREGGGSVRLLGPGGDGIEAGRAVVCAGLWSDRLAVRSGAGADPRIVPFRGGYLRLREGREQLVRGLVYPVPDPSLPFLGVHLTRSVDDRVLVGPTALLVGARDAYRLWRIRPLDLAETVAWPGTWRLAARWWRTGLRELRYAADAGALALQAARYVPAIGPNDLEPAGPGAAGVRAQAVGRDGRLLDDFALWRTERTLHVRNAPSPAATSSLALAEHIAGLVL